MTRKLPTKSQGNAVRRCAIYTRKSSEEGLDQAFNSLDAQREACDAYIRSQRHEGWIALPTFYDDGGISGGTMERPALQRLLADIHANRVDLVVVYKVDRLTRSLADFAKIVEVFDTNGASFVSVTQQFNTTTSMGRLTLNMLLSFAQFEREVTGERIRDKIAASKRKGIWMGGVVPLGYDVQHRKLVVNLAEAERLLHIFRSYLELGSVRRLREQLVAGGITGKQRSVTGSRAHRSGASMSRGALYLTLQNRLYRGEVHHKGEYFPGEHPPIIDAALWDAVQARLPENRNERRLGTRAAHPSLLAGLVFDDAGERLTPTHATKDQRRYRYYVSQPCRGNGANDGLRVAAGDLEGIVIQRLRDFLGRPTELFAATNTHAGDAYEQRAVLARAAELAASWSKQSATEQRAMLRGIVARVMVRPDEVILEVSPTRLAEALGVAIPIAVGRHMDDTPIILTSPVQLTRWKKEVRLLIKGPAGETRPNPALIRLLTKAHAFWGALVQESLTITALATREGVTGSYITRLIRLAFIAPDITTAILNGQQPAAMTADTLLVYGRLPLAWSEQRKLLGI